MAAIPLLIALAASRAIAGGGAARAPAASVPPLGDGVLLSSAPGYLAKSFTEPGLLTFRIDARSAAETRRALFLMPCDATDDARAMLEDPNPDSPVLFEVTGTVHEYHGRSFLLPISIVPLRAPAPPPMIARIAPADMRRPEDRRAAARPPRTDAYAELEAAGLDATPVREVPADRMAHEPNPAAFPGLDDGLAEALERRLDAGIASSGTGTAPKRIATQYERGTLVSPGTRLLDRRATILRDPVTGAWRARIDTGRPGTGPVDGAEVSMELLPSRALEQLERAVRQRTVGTDWLLSGEVVVARDRNYLLLRRAVPSPQRRFESP